MNAAERGAPRWRQFASNVCSAARLLFRAPPQPARKPAWPPHSRLALGALASIVVVVFAVLALDIRSVTAARELPPWLIGIFRVMTDFGLSGWFLIPTAVALLLLAFMTTAAAPDFLRREVAALSIRIGFVFVAIAGPGLLVAIVKRLIGRARPFVAGNDTWTSMLGTWRADYASFPSGHATTSFAAAIAIGALWPKLRPIMWAYAILIAVSRVIVTVHHPSDVIAGAIVGTLGALLVRNWYATRRLGFVVAADGGVHKLPGPSWRRIKAVARKLVSA